MTNGLALRQGHLGFAQHADNLFRGVAFTAHFVLLSRGQNAPNSLNKSGPLLGGHSTPASTMAHWRCEGRGPTYVKVGLKVAYRGDHLNDWIEAQTVRPSAAA